MEKNLLVNEIIVASSDAKKSAIITQLKKEGRLRKISPRIYTTNPNDTDENIVKRNFHYIIGSLYPNALISHRSAFEMRPTDNGHFYLTYSYTKNIFLPGVTIHLIKGHKAINGDIPYLNNLYISSSARAYLENLQLGYVRNGISKCLDQAALEEKLEKKLRANGEKELNKIRDEARSIAKELSMQQEFQLLDKIIGAILSTQSVDTLKTTAAKAWAIGEPFDSERLHLFSILFETLNNKDFISRPEQNLTRDAYKNFAFFESYFSNYIEGTEFEIDEAKKIIDDGVPVPTRDEDSHDILGTFYIVSNKKEMSVTPSSPDDFINLLQKRHSIMLSARLSSNPGLFKEHNNKAGNTHFVDFRLVRGTLKKAFEIYHALTNPIAKAIFMLFMVSDVHPFDDGNGRISRIMMNAELTATGESKIIIPTVFRTDYTGALRRLSRNGDPSVLIRAMERVRLFSSTLRGDNYDALLTYLEQSNAFKDEKEYILRF